MKEFDIDSDELSIDIDNYELDDNDKTIREPVVKRDKQLKRWFLTINNPFWKPDEDVEVDMQTNELPVKYDYYNYEFIKSFNNVDLFEFHFVKVTAKVEETHTEKVLKEEKTLVNGIEQTKYVEVEIEKKVKVDKELVVERPYFKNYETFKLYVEGLQVEGLKWSTGQVERGKKDNTIHLQFIVVFDDKHGKRFYTMKKYFPTAYLDKIKSRTNYEPMAYCTKEDTRVEEPFCIGTPTEVGSRQDLDEFKMALKNGATNLELVENYFSVVVKIGINNLDAYRDVYLGAYYENNCRNVEVTFISGVGGTGKTKNVYKEFGFSNVFRISNYGKFAFHGYKSQKVVIFDEYNGQFSIDHFKEILDVHPFNVEVKNGQRVACYDKVFILSNYPFDELYKSEKEKNIESYKAFERRIHHIFSVDSKGNYKREKETIFEDVSEDEIELSGWTKRPSKIIKYDKYGRSSVVFDLHSNNEQVGFEEVVSDKLPFSDEEKEIVDEIF